MKPASRWANAHNNLKRLYGERAPSGMSLKDFGLKFDLGTKGMVWQYLSGHRPLNYEAAAKFARGLNCTIYEISPEMADSLKEEILPVLGRALRRAAALACFALIPLTAPAPADAAAFVRCNSQLCIMSTWRRRLRQCLDALGALFGASAATACTTIDQHTAPPPDWPQLKLFEHHVPHNVMRDQCVQWTGWWASSEACAVVNFELMRCDMWFSADFPPLRAWLEHEYMHCAGHDHQGETPVLANAWREYKAGAAGKSIAESVR